MSLPISLPTGSSMNPSPATPQERNALSSVFLLFSRATPARLENGEGGGLFHFLSPRTVGEYLAERLVPPLPWEGALVADLKAQEAFADRVCADPTFARQALDQLRESFSEFPCRVFDYYCIAATLASLTGRSMMPETDADVPDPADSDEDDG